MSSGDFKILINLIGPKIQKMNKQFREAVPVSEGKIGCHITFSGNRRFSYKFAIPLQNISPETILVSLQFFSSHLYKFLTISQFRPKHFF
jgi:hypothetical protein